MAGRHSFRIWLCASWSALLNTQCNRRRPWWRGDVDDDSNTESSKWRLVKADTGDRGLVVRAHSSRTPTTCTLYPAAFRPSRSLRGQDYKQQNTPTPITVGFGGPTVRKMSSATSDVFKLTTSCNWTRSWRSIVDIDVDYETLTMRSLFTPTTKTWQEKWKHRWPRQDVRPHRKWRCAIWC